MDGLPQSFRGMDFPSVNQPRVPAMDSPSVRNQFLGWTQRFRRQNRPVFSRDHSGAEVRAPDVWARFPPLIDSWTVGALGTSAFWGSSGCVLSRKFIFVGRCLPLKLSFFSSLAHEALWTLNLLTRIRGNLHRSSAARCQTALL